MNPSPLTDHADEVKVTIALPNHTQSYRKVLWVALIVNALMFVVEVVFGKVSDSVALLSDAIDFFGDATSYGLSLWVLQAGIFWSSRVALGKGWVMIAYGLLVLAKSAFNVYYGLVPSAYLMGSIGILAFFANFGVAWLLYAFREGDANMRAVWLCTRNDALGNIAIILAAIGVFGMQSYLPDVLVALSISGLAVSAGIQVVRQSREEIRTGISSHSNETHSH